MLEELMLREEATLEPRLPRRLAGLLSLLLPALLLLLLLLPSLKTAMPARTTVALSDMVTPRWSASTVALACSASCCASASGAKVAGARLSSGLSTRCSSK